MGSRYDCCPRDITSRGRRPSRGQHVTSRGYIVLVTSRGCLPWMLCDVPWVNILWTHGVENMKISRGCQIMLYPVGVWCGYHVHVLWVTTIEDCYPRHVSISPTGYTHSIRSWHVRMSRGELVGMSRAWAGFPHASDASTIMISFKSNTEILH